MAPTAQSIQVKGLRELRRELKRIDRELPRELAKVNQEVAEIFAGEMRTRAPKGPHQGGGRVTPIAPSVKAGRQQARGVVAIGGARSPHALPINFGGTIARYHSTSRTRVVAREFIFSSLGAKRDEGVDRYGELLEKLMRRAFPDGLAV
jgi:hypothetical protein